ncbi:MAG: protein-L-isoaspartate O-methyltransferase [Anaerolineae bacterium]|nr:MAG: protein-L-isoaspartate O-methyltransferase [Anaerolineae bacterium]
MDDEQTQARRRMVNNQLIPRGIRDPRVLAAFEAIPRHLFVPPEYQSWAYDDAPQPIGHEQTISQPYIVALMSELLSLTGVERVLEVGTGSGYQAAILAKLAAEVHTVELIPALAERARRTLEALNLTNVYVHCADGSLGWPEAAPYQGILVAAAAPAIPPPLLAQLAEAGRLVLPVGARGFQRLEVWRKVGNAFSNETILPVAFVPLRGKHGWK